MFQNHVLNCHFIEDDDILTFHPVEFLIHLCSSLNNGLRVVEHNSILFVSLARSPI